jgi:hypothetical protein
LHRPVELAEEPSAAAVGVVVRAVGVVRAEALIVKIIRSID